MDALVLIPVIALIALSSVRFERATGRGRACWAAALAVVAAFLFARSFVPDEAAFFASEAARKVRAQVRDFRKALKEGKREIIVIEGSSVAMHGSDNKLLAQLLAEGGRDAAVLQFSAQGANHFERAFMLEAFWRALAPAERSKLEAADVTLLKEVFDAYDREPLYLVEKEQYLDRASSYFGPAYAAAAWRAVRASSAESLPPDKPAARSLQVAAALSERVLRNRFAVGAFSEMDLGLAGKRAAAFFPLDGKKDKFDFFAAAVSADMRDTGENVPPAGWVEANDFERSRTPWIDRRLQVVFPAVENRRSAYGAAFASAVPGTIGPPSAEKMAPLMGPEFWFDGVHPTGRGAELFTRWLAGELLEKKPHPDK